jgi:nucleoside-diphosphate-sugar epimerase
MKHLVLGSAGQIGNHLVTYLKNQNQDVFEYDIVNSINEDLRMYNNKLEYLIEKCDFIYFLAFDVGGAKYLEKYQHSYNFINNNLKIMTNTFELIKKYNKPFIFASSQMSEISDSTYGLLKLIGERTTQSLNGIVARFWNVYGYEKDGEKSHVITDFIKMAKYDGVIKMRTDGEESRQFLYADDCSECLFILSKKYHNIEKQSPIHITNFKWTKIIEIAKYIQSISKCKIIVNDRKDQTQKNAMNTPNENILNYWKPKTSLTEGINKLYKKY